MNKLRTEIRRQIKKILLEQYASGNIVMSGNPGDFFGGRNYVRSYDFEKEKTNTKTSVETPVPNNSGQNKQKQNQNANPKSPPTRNQSTPPNLGNVSFDDRDLGGNKVQLKEGFEVHKSGSQEITIKDLKNKSSKKYYLQVSGTTVNIEKIFLVDTGSELQFQMTASVSIITKTAIMTNENKKDIIKNFLLGTTNFAITGKDTKGNKATVTFIKI